MPREGRPRSSTFAPLHHSMDGRQMGSPRTAVALVLVACSSSPPPPDPACLPGANGHVDAPPIHTPRWAFEPWLSKDYSSADDTLGFVQGSIDRGIPVGVAVLDI